MVVVGVGEDNKFEWGIHWGDIVGWGKDYWMAVCGMYGGDWRVMIV